MDTLPLLPESTLDSITAFRGSGPVTGRQFLQDVLALAEQLPDAEHLLNLCKDRYRFATALFAAIARDKRSILPNSFAPEIVAGLKRQFPDLACIGDQAGIRYELPYLQVPERLEGPVDQAMPRVPAERPILYVYTSGSTGKPQRHAKTLGQMRQSTLVGANRLWQIAGGPCNVLGAVPFLHMFGLESTVFLPLLGGGRLSSRLPFFPADVASALAELPEPRLLVTTPFHLRKLLDAPIEYPAIATVLSATAPMTLELAAEAEARLGTPVAEIYGSTETGQIATRQPTRQGEWDLYEGIELKTENNCTIVSGGHLRAPERLNDIVERCGPSQFKLLGRNADIVNVAGKRSSLSYLNQIMAGIPGVRDGVFCVPDRHPGRDIARLAAFVVAPGLTARDIQSALLDRLDPVFLPRPTVFLDHLPRDGNGKLSAAALAELIASHMP